MMNIFGGWKLPVMLGLAIGIGFAAWWTIRTWGNDIRKAVYEELFADLVAQQNEQLGKQVKELNTRLQEQERIYREEAENRQRARGVTDRIRARTAGKADSAPADVLRETMAVIYEQQQSEVTRGQQP